jgi:hypothetical protein
MQNILNMFCCIFQGLEPVFRWNIPVVLPSNIYIPKHRHAQHNLQILRLLILAFQSSTGFLYGSWYWIGMMMA